MLLRQNNNYNSYFYSLEFNAILQLGNVQRTLTGVTVIHK